MLPPFDEETAAVYGNIVDEVKIRLHLIERALQTLPLEVLRSDPRIVVVYDREGVRAGVRSREL